MNRILTTAGQFSLFFFVVLAIIYWVETFFPLKPSVLGDVQVMLPVTLLYTGGFFTVKKQLAKKALNRKSNDA
jgi:apolipoprotein N-acyltransferase